MSKEPPAPKATKSKAPRKPVAKRAQRDPVRPLTREEQATVAEFLGELPDHLPKETVKSLVQSMSFSGPLPPPALLQEYDKTLPGCAERVVRMAEKEQDARHVDNRKIVHTDRMRAIFAFIVSLALIIAAVIAAYLGQPEVAIPLGLAGTLTGIVKAVVDWLKAGGANESAADKGNG